MLLRCFIACLLAVGCILPQAAYGDAKREGSEAVRVEPGHAEPRIELKESLHYFGVMQPNELASHSFKVKNTGNASLRLETPKGSCRCLEMRVTKQEIPPGGEGEVYVRWRAAENAGESFRQTVRVPTNAPDRPTLEFVIAGDVGGHLSIEPTRLEWANVASREPRSAKIKITSRYWNRMQISGLSISKPGLAVREVKGEVQASDPLIRSSKLIEVTVPAEVTDKSFETYINMTISSVDQPRSFHVANEAGPTAGSKEKDESRINDNPAEIQIPVTFDLAPALSMIGVGYDPDAKRMKLGIQKPGQELVRRCLVKVRDDEKSLALASHRVEPASIGVQLLPYRPEAGLYRLELRSPANSLKRGFIGSSAGYLDLKFDHPRIEDLKLELEIAPGN